MHNKEALHIIFHITPDLLENNYQLLQSSSLIVNYLLLQNILYQGKTDRISLSMVNVSDEKLDFDIQSFMDFTTAKFSNLKSIEQFHKILTQPDFKLINDSSMNDIFNFGIEHFEQRVGKKKYNQKLIIISNGNCHTDIDENTLNLIGWKLKANNIRTNFVSLGFFEKDNPNDKQKEMKEWLKKLSKNAGEFKIYDKDITLSLLSDFKVKKRSNTSNFRGNFELAPSLNIKVISYTKTRTNPAFDFKKYAKKNKYNALSKDTIIETKKVFINPEDIELNPLDNDKIIKGYYYGQELIPIDKELEANMEYKISQRSMKLLGFIGEETFQRHLSIGPVDCVFPDENDQKSVLAFNSVVESMLHLNRLAIVRVVKAANRSPKINIMYPKKKINKKTGNPIYFLYMSELPTSEDMRMYNFGSIKTSNQKERAMMKEFIERMDIDNFINEDGEIEELLKPKEIPNPRNQVMFDRIIQKGLGVIDNSAPINVPDNIKEILYTETLTHPKVADIDDKLKDIFGLEELVEQEEKVEKVYWTDILKAEKGLTEEERQALKNKNKDDEPIIRKISKNYPISDFRDMLRNRKEDLVESAVKQMQDHIVDTVKNTMRDDVYEKALECFIVMREGCVNEEEFDLFNDFLYMLKKKSTKDPNFETFFQKIKDNKLSLIHEKEVVLCKVNKEESIKFIED